MSIPSVASIVLDSTSIGRSALQEIINLEVDLTNYPRLSPNEVLIANITIVGGSNNSRRAPEVVSWEEPVNNLQMKLSKEHDFSHLRSSGYKYLDLDINTYLKSNPENNSNLRIRLNLN